MNATYVAENKLWYSPECTVNGSDGQAGPSPRAFHVAVVIDCNMFIFGGRSGGKRYAIQIANLAGFGSLTKIISFIVTYNAVFVSQFR